jgi:hypothetical protein
MTFTKPEQKKHRAAFIEECRQKAWSAACHADWISKSLDELMAHYQKLKEEEQKLAADIKESENAFDYHTNDNRAKRKGMQERRNQINGIELPAVAQNAQKATQAMQQLLQSTESNLLLAEHAEKWEWKEVEAKPEPHEEDTNKKRPTVETQG